jgi:hypothetical protein
VATGLSTAVGLSFAVGLSLPVALSLPVEPSLPTALSLPAAPSLLGAPPSALPSGLSVLALLLPQPAETKLSVSAATIATRERWPTA